MQISYRVPFSEAPSLYAENGRTFASLHDLEGGIRRAAFLFDEDSGGYDKTEVLITWGEGADAREYVARVDVDTSCRGWSLAAHLRSRVSGLDMMAGDPRWASQRESIQEQRAAAMDLLAVLDRASA
jgi:hypothetical protein